MLDTKRLIKLNQINYQTFNTLQNLNELLKNGILKPKVNN